MTDDQLYAVSYPKIENGKTYWVRVGTAFKHAENGRITVKLDCLPLQQFWPDGKLVLFPKDESK